MFRYNGVRSKDKEKVMTQFGRALYELNIDLICANTCQAKGRPGCKGGTSSAPEW